MFLCMSINFVLDSTYYEYHVECQSLFWHSLFFFWDTIKLLRNSLILSGHAFKLCYLLSNSLYSTATVAPLLRQYSSDNSIQYTVLGGSLFRYPYLSCGLETTSRQQDWQSYGLTHLFPLLGITELHCTLSNIWKSLFHTVCLFLLLFKVCVWGGGLLPVFYHDETWKYFFPI